MQYTDGSFADVKSISQQAMCRYWARTAGDLPFPSLDQFRPEARLHDPKQLIIWSVERREDGRTFRALYQGTSVGEVFNSSWAGKSMEEVLPPALGVRFSRRRAVRGQRLRHLQRVFDLQQRRPYDRL
ncbi:MULTISPECIES: hypothetical protein [unclassified Bradyrhizobium]|uniref:hypothetical protein n=1 Tax=unclassified Bradyrhizobium TaxID=2631580 RepID=UPI001FF9929B|nr:MULTISPECIES: hypothetical protein [unclassified Bradyrhizobium]MCK1292593.1 hypothetical protein [Bradyrhizobium sp. 30]MCK1346456.1 hypothetical protein [Bradyrhizobium sp. CW11]MCK1471330.1 hypothetical protein [Bradyrhizobium sp. CW10]MCK1510084.1 hypothetical protein [Bradyrhizobium sp. 18]